MENQEVANAEGKQASEDQEKPVFIAGEVHIIVDGKTGSISINSPQNNLVTLGILEGAKVLVTKQMIDAINRNTRPAIVPANVDALEKLRRVS